MGSGQHPLFFAPPHPLSPLVPVPYSPPLLCLSVHVYRTSIGKHRFQALSPAYFMPQKPQNRPRSPSLFLPLTPSTRLHSVFDSALYKNLNAKWRFPQEKATLHDLKMSAMNRKRSRIALRLAS